MGRGGKTRCQTSKGIMVRSEVTDFDYVRPRNVCYSSIYPEWWLHDIVQRVEISELNKFRYRGKFIFLTLVIPYRELPREWSIIMVWKKAFEGVWPIIFDPSFLWWVFSAERAIIVQPSFLRYIFFVTNNRNLSFQLIFPTDESVIPIFCRVLLYCCTMGSWNFAWTVDNRKGSGVSYPTQRPELPELCVSGDQTHLR